MPGYAIYPAYYFISFLGNDGLGGEVRHAVIPLPMAPIPIRMYAA